MIGNTELERLYDEHAGALFGYLLNLTRHEADTRDLLQEIFTRLAQRPDTLLGVASPRAFLLRWAHNLAMDRLRRLDVRERYQRADNFDGPALFAPAPDPDSQSFRRALDDALAELPIEQRSVVHLKLWGGLTFAEIAQLLEIPPNTAVSRYRYGIDKLRDVLRPLYEEIQ